MIAGASLLWVGSAAFAGDVISAMVGTWKLNVDKTQWNGPSALKSYTVTVTDVRVLTLFEAPVVAVFEADFPFRFPPLCSKDREAEVGTRCAAGPGRMNPAGRFSGGYATVASL